MQSVDFKKFVQGDLVQCFVRIKPPNNFQKEDIRVNNNNIILTENNRIMEEFESQQTIWTPDLSTQSMYDSAFSNLIGPFIQGINVNFFAYGSSGAGKSQTLEGNKKEHGLIIYFASTLFSILENKKFHTNQAANSLIRNYTYGFRVRYVEIIDEEVNDLLAPPNKRLSDQLQVLDNAWEGPIIANSQWITVNNETQLNEVLMAGQRNRNQTSNEFGKVGNKATAVFTIQLIQNSETNDEIKQRLVIISNLTFFDLPGSEIMIDDPETIRIKQGSTLNKAIMAFTQLIKELGQPQQSDFATYDSSVVTHLCKELLGTNSMTVGIFCVQQGDLKGSSLTLNVYKYCTKIQSFPIVNDGKAIGLLHRFRLETQQARLTGKGGFQDGNNQKMIELEKKLIEDNLDKMRNADDKQKMAQKLSAIREKYNEMVRQKAEREQELIKSEEEKLEVSKALVELQIENTRLMEIIQNEKYDMNNRLLNAESDMLGMNVREEKALKKIQELQDQLKEMMDDKRALEIEFVALKKNYINVNAALEAERAKSENIGLELINVVNENKALHQELNDIYKKSGNTNEENLRFVRKIEQLEHENRQQREALIHTKAEIERLKTEMLKYEILDQQHRIDLDNKKLETEKGFMEANREKQNEMYKINRDVDESNKRIKEERMLWESQKMEMTTKIKQLQRRVNDEEDRIKELEKIIQDLQSDLQKAELQTNEMRSLYRNKLLQFTTEGKSDKATRIGYDLNAREELIRTYTEKEIDLNEKLERERKVVKQAKLEVKSVKQYARNLRYLCEDWAPVGIPLPDILTKDPAFLEDEYQSNPDNTAEIERLRARNKKLENEVRVLQENIMNGMGGTDINKRLANELEMLKQGNSSNVRGPYNDIQSDQIRKERNDLQEENRRLVTLLKDNKKWDVYILQRENERLIKQIKEQELGLGAVGPQSGENRSVNQKMMLYEKSIKQLEQERSQLMVRATMAEEQLKALQEHLTKQNQEMQKKVMEMKRNGGSNFY